MDDEVFDIAADIESGEAFSVHPKDLRKEGTPHGQGKVHLPKERQNEIRAERRRARSLSHFPNDLRCPRCEELCLAARSRTKAGICKRCWLELKLLHCPSCGEVGGPPVNWHWDSEEDTVKCKHCRSNNVGMDSGERDET